MENLKIRKVDGARDIKGFKSPTCDIYDKQNNRKILEKFVNSEDIFYNGGQKWKKVIIDLCLK